MLANNAFLSQSIILLQVLNVLLNAAKRKYIVGPPRADRRGYRRSEDKLRKFMPESKDV